VFQFSSHDEHHSLFVIVVIVAVLLPGCREDNQNTNATEAGIPVEVTTAHFGGIAAENEVKVFSKIPDRIEQFFVDEGDRVSKGAPFAQVFCPTIEQSVRQAEAALLFVKTQEANLRVEYARFEKLYRDLTVSQQQYDAAATQFQATQALVQQAEAALASAKSQWHDATVRAPIAGIIGKRYYEAGDLAAPAHAVRH
jgi:membrane fusion protein (multidrug efflux system)